MTLRIQTPANLIDFAELVQARSRLMWSVAREMYDGGETWSVYHDDDLLMVGGLYPFDPETGEAWFCAASKAAPHMLPLVRAIRLTLQRSRYREIVTLVQSDAGRRIARATGFSFFKATEAGEVWHVRNFRQRERRGTGEATTGVAATAQPGGTRQAAGGS